MTRRTTSADNRIRGPGAFAKRRISIAALTFAALAGADDSGRRLYEGSITANPSNPTPGSLTMPQQQGLTLSARSHDVTAGIVEAFLHREHLENGELQCLVRGTGDLAGNVMSVSESMVELLKEALNGGEAPGASKVQQTKTAPADPNDGADKIAAMVKQISAGKAPKQDAGTAVNAKPSQTASHGSAAPEQPTPEQQHKDAASKSLAFFYGSRRLQSSESMIVSVPMLMMQLGLSVKEIVGLVQDILKECVKGDALKAIETAGKHLQDAEYVSGRLMANGADIASELSDAVVAYENKDFRAFGQNLGKSLRKVLLSQSVSRDLPEGPPDAFVLANVSAGILRGFFGEGFAVDLEAEEGYDPIHIDLHDCVGKNIPFFQSMWAATMFFYGKKASQTEDSEAVKTDVKKKPGSWASALALAMLQIPTALRRCGLGPEQKEMLLNSIKTLGSGMHHTVDMPSAESVSKKDMATEMAKTVKEWAHHDWYKFGYDLGRVLQDMFVTVYSTKYSVDGTGTLRKRLIAEAASARSPMLQGSAGHLLNALPAVPLAAVPLAVAALALKARREFTRHLRFSADEASPYRGEDPEALE